MATNPENETLFSCFHYRGCCTVLYEDTLLPGTFCNRKGHVRKAWRRSKFITNFQHIFFFEIPGISSSFQDNAFQKVEALASLTVITTRARLGLHVHSLALSIACACKLRCTGLDCSTASGAAKLG